VRKCVDTKFIAWGEDCVSVSETLFLVDLPSTVFIRTTEVACATVPASIKCRWPLTVTANGRCRWPNAEIAERSIVQRNALLHRPYSKIHADTNAHGTECRDLLFFICCVSPYYRI
jgi:hypothetical protein